MGMVLDTQTVDKCYVVSPDHETSIHSPCVVTISAHSFGEVSRAESLRKGEHYFLLVFALRLGQQLTIHFTLILWLSRRLFSRPLTCAFPESAPNRGGAVSTPEPRRHLIMSLVYPTPTVLNS
jgi:hypothetical protein